MNIRHDMLVNLFGVYRPPAGNMDSFSDIMFNRILPQINANAPVLLFGDFNFDILNPNETDADVIQNFSSLSFHPLITDVTRPKDNGGNCIDHIWSNNSFSSVSGLFDILVTDHLPIFTVLKCNSISRHILKKFRDHSAPCLSKLKSAATLRR